MTQSLVQKLCRIKPADDVAAEGHGGEKSLERSLGVFSLAMIGIGATIASGIDAKNNPGVDAVKRDCAGMDESCATYQKGRDAQFRTNVILGGTIGVGVLTAVVGTFFTRWSPTRRDFCTSSAGPTR